MRIRGFHLLLRSNFSPVNIFKFFYHCLPPENIPCLELSELHAVIRDIWLKRYDDELAEEIKSRRPGRPKSVKEQNIEELKLREV